VLWAILADSIGCISFNGPMTLNIFFGCVHGKAGMACDYSRRKLKWMSHSSDIDLHWKSGVAASYQETMGASAESLS